MEIKDMTMEDIEKRSLEIEEEMNREDVDVEALSKEVEELEARKAEILAEVEQRKKEAEEALKTAKEIEAMPEERKTMDIKELRNTPRYIDAFAEMVKGNDKEMRALLLSENVEGDVAIPSFVEDRIYTDWDKLPILSRVHRVAVKGNYRVGYEESATGAVKHTEGTDAPQDETLKLKYIDFVAQYIKKWIKVSDTVLALRGEAFLSYLLDEFGYQIGLALENAIVAEIKASALSAKVTNPLDNTAVMAGFAKLSDEATNPVVICSKATYATIMNARTTAGAKIEDPFNGMEVLFNNSVTGMLVGDLNSVVVNLPEGAEIKYIIDDKSLAEADLIKIVGKLMADAHLVRPNGFAVVTAE